MATPLRFRYSPSAWSPDRVRSDLYDDLDANIGAESVDPRFRLPGPWQSWRFEMTNGDVALFAHGDGEAFWMGNTETPAALWRTDKRGWRDVPYPVARWAQRELIADLTDAAPWLADHPHLRWFFLPVFMSKDGRDSTRRFFREHAAGFPDADWRAGVDFYERFLATGVLDDHRAVMAGKLGTSEYLDLTRMRAAMGEFTAAKLLSDAGYAVEPEIERESGHSLDFRATRDGRSNLIEVTRPQPPAARSTTDPAAAIRETVGAKTGVGDQLRANDDAVLLVDCTSFPDDRWHAVRDVCPDPGYDPTVVFRARPDGHVEGYVAGDPPSLAAVIDRVDR
ncbi:hypothetical protein BRD17_06325 [Halobacteriales archaeon SW_7_68_16]|nr:MAG: hypothetical protein BRD17_06325 [Halobacteriales archaeon SW_7_68_16]